MEVILDNENADKVLFIGRAFGFIEEFDVVKTTTVVKLLIFDQVNSYRKDKERFIARWKNNRGRNDKESIINTSKKNDDTENKKKRG